MRSAPNPPRGSRDKVASPSWPTERGELCGGAPLARAGVGAHRGGRGSAPDRGGERSWGGTQGPTLGDTWAALRAPQQCALRPPPRAALIRARRSPPARARPRGRGRLGSAPLRPRPEPPRPRARRSGSHTRCASRLFAFPGAQCLSERGVWDPHLLLVLGY